MRQLSATELLDAWERALAESPPARALTLLSAATGLERARLALLTVGERDRLLLALRELIFGARLDALADCPACGERLEMSFEVADVTAGRGAGDAGALALASDGYEAAFRAPNCLDALAVARASGPEDARRALLSRCLLSVRRGEEEVPPELLPEELVGRVAALMADADPQADVELALECPGCGHGWGETFDICSFLWGEIGAWATRTLGEVHALARAYGWGEREILSMSPWRRQLYLAMVSG